MIGMDTKLLEIKNLSVQYTVDDDVIRAVNNVSLEINHGETLGLVGETGAGKSIIIDAINAVLGERTSKEIIRTGASSASVSALFTGINADVTKILDGLEIPHEDNELQIRREIKPGKTISKANGVPITATMLKDIGKELISIHGQHDSYDLLTPDIHGRYIDAFGKTETLLSLYREQYYRLRQIKTELDKLNIDESQKTRRIDLLTYQKEEIESADVKLSERDELIKRRDSIKNGENIITNATEARVILNGDSEVGGILSQISVAANSLEDAGRNYEPLLEQAQKLRSIEYLLEDVNAEVRDFVDNFDFNPSELDSIEERLDLLYRLSLKYGETEEKVVDFYNVCCEELKNINLSDEKIELLTAEFEDVKSKAIKLAKELSEKRKSAAMRFSEDVKAQLKFLNMPSVEFSVQQERTSLNSFGCDKIQFLVSANIGEDPKPMSKIASGGELSRIMLAIKTVLSDGDNVVTLIFDEVDTGISGEAAHKVGLKLKEAAGERQVICITHLAQIAAMAQNQMLIKKNTDGKKTYTEVTLLDHQGRLHELSRIIGGDEITPLKLRMAEEMLNNS